MRASSFVGDAVFLSFLNSIIESRNHQEKPKLFPYRLVVCVIHNLPISRKQQQIIEELLERQAYAGAANQDSFICERISCMIF